MHQIFKTEICNIIYELCTSSQNEFFDYISKNPESNSTIMLFKILKEKKIQVLPGSGCHYIPTDFDFDKLKLANEIASQFN